MSPRPKRLRKISSPPLISGLKPYGDKVVEENTGSIFLHYEEYESLRLCDHEMLNHYEAAEIMNVSRPTLTRIYARARQKIAEALVLGKQIIIEGGKIYYDSNWYTCAGCGCHFNNPFPDKGITECPLCHNRQILLCTDYFYDMEEGIMEAEDMCVCTACGFEQPHRRGIPCRKEKCPKCNQYMVRKGTPHEKRSKLKRM